MAIDLEQLKQKMPDSLKRLLGKQPQADETEKVAESPTDRVAPAKGKVSSKFAGLARDLADLKAALQEGKLTLFVKQVFVLAGVILLVRYAHGQLTQQRAAIEDKNNAIELQQVNRDEYLNNKQHLLRLEVLFPDLSQKDEWMAQRLMNIFREHQTPVSIEENMPEDSSSPIYTSVSRGVSFQQNFNSVGRLTEDIENGSDFLRITSLNLTKLTDTDSLGDNTVTMTFSTVFPKTKYAPALFKDYEAQMAKIKQETGEEQ